MSVENSQINVHCLVHPGFDPGEHPEFEASIHAYIEYFAHRTNDVFLIVSHGESFDNEQLQQFALLDTIEALVYYLALRSSSLRDSFSVYKEGKYNPTLSYEGLTETLYKWCQQNIDTSELDNIQDAWEQLRGDYLQGIYKDNMEEHNNKAGALRNKEKELREQFDIAGFARKALEELGATSPRKSTYRKIQNPRRFFRIHQHAMQAFGRDRMREIFIADGEIADIVSIQPVSHFQEFEGDMVPTPLVQQEGDDFQAQVFNASEASTYGTAAKLRDELTYKLSVSRNQKLVAQELKKLLKDMGVQITDNTNFKFLGEYRDRCVNNVLRVLNYRLSPVTGDNFYLAHDSFTLPRPADYVSTDWE